MALNSITHHYYNIKEIEESESIPPPRITNSGLFKTIYYKYNNNNKNTLYNKYYLNLNNNYRKSKSFCSYFSVYKLYDNFFTENLITKESRNKRYNDNKNLIKNLKEFSSNKKTKKISKSISLKNKNNYLFSNLSKKEDEDDFKNSSEEQIDSNKNLYKRINNKRIIKFQQNTNTNKKMNQKKINKLNIENDFDKPRIKINESLSLRKINTERSNIINYSATEFFNENNMTNQSINKLVLKLQNVPYIRKKVKNFKINEKNNLKKNKKISMSQSMSVKSFSIHSEKSIKKGKFIKKFEIKKKLLDIKNFLKIKNTKNILNILRFLDYYDLINIFATKNKKFLSIINKATMKLYYTKIKSELEKFNTLFDLIQCNITRTKIKDALKIDIVANIRININQKNNNDILEPLYIKLAYAYNYFKKIKPNKELITKEEYENQIGAQSEKMCDFYSFDFYPQEFYHKHKNIKNNKIYISKELPIQGKDSNNIATVQSILPFTEDDQGLLNFEIYNAEKGFVNYEEIRMKIKIYNLNNYLKHLAKKEINNIRISEYEELCSYWKNINLYVYKDLIIKMMKTYFGNFFEVKKIFFDNIGIYIFKVQLKAIKSGIIKNKKNVGINIKIIGKNDTIKNEIRKNNLLFEKRDVIEVKVGDEIMYYFCLK